jgi:5-methylcytosine-specific restriction protein A
LYHPYWTVCCVCGFDFVATYGEVMAGFTHVHHLKPLATIGGGYQLDPVQDLRPVCPNCHAVIHRREPPYTIEEVRQLLRPGSEVEPLSKPSDLRKNEHHDTT